jgi:hypothetical protein
MLPRDINPTSILLLGVEGCLERAIRQVLYEIEMLGSVGVTIVVSFETGGYWAREDGIRAIKKANVRRYMIVQSCVVN